MTSAIPPNATDTADATDAAGTNARHVIGAHLVPIRSESRRIDRGLAVRQETRSGS
jgi:hypothetical protein